MRVVLFLFLVMLQHVASGQELPVVAEGKSAYRIAAGTSREEMAAALLLQKALQQATGVAFPLVKKEAAAEKVFIVTSTTSQSGWELKVKNGNILLSGGSLNELQLAVTAFAARFLGAQKWDQAPATYGKKAGLTLPATFNAGETPAFRYREAYYPYSRDAEYRAWTGLQQFETLWGLWGHSYDKLVPAKTYFAAHPEYYALVNGKRQASQLCLSNEHVFRITVEALRARMSDDPDAVYWSISPNDDLGYCTCERCKAIDDKEGGPQGSLIHFLNKVAAVFPDKQFTTLAYTYTSHPTRTLKPAGNVYIMLSTIDAYRGRPLQEEPSAAAFIRDLKGWSTMTPNIFIWDYNTQFTNYLAPFPNLHTMAANLRFFKEQQVQGVFMQGSGDTYGELAELRSWVTAQLLRHPYSNEDSLLQAFITDYYGRPAAPSVHAYLAALEKNFKESKRPLDIYGNPILEWNSYLKPEQIDAYSALLDKAEAATQGNTRLQERIVRLRLPLEYTVLQQAKMYGRDKHGLYEQGTDGTFRVKNSLLPRVRRFVAACTKAGVTELSEGGQSPAQYLQEYTAILERPVLQNIAWKAPVQLTHPFAPEYPARGVATLTDGASGFSDFSYNWLCFYGVPMEAVIDLGSVKALKEIQLHFLDDPRHWIFTPESVTIWTSADGINYRKAGEKKWGMPEEHYDLNIVPSLFVLPAGSSGRFVKVTARNLDTLPEWRSRVGKKSMLACDEIWIQ